MHQPNIHPTGNTTSFPPESGHVHYNTAILTHDPFVHAPAKNHIPSALPPSESDPKQVVSPAPEQGTEGTTYSSGLTGELHKILPNLPEQAERLGGKSNGEDAAFKSGGVEHTTVPPRLKKGLLYLREHRQLQATTKQDKIPASSQPAPQPKKKSFVKKLLSDVLFFVVLLGFVLGMVFYKQAYQPGSSVLGYSFYTVLTGSMEREIPKGSMVVVHSVPGSELQVGDDITFYRDKDTIVTHRIINIVEDFEGSGGLGFITQGLENPMPDAQGVHEQNVVGKVVMKLPSFGGIISMIGTNLKWVILLPCLIFAFIFSLLIFFSSEKKTKKEANEQADSRTTT